jgi:hypothetical protein
VIPHGYSYDMPHHKNLHEAKRDTTCSLCSNPIKRGETIVVGRRGNVTCRECIGPDAKRTHAPEQAGKLAHSPHETGR